ncbi:hypothetical protein BJ166DRAFT_515944 [Pestalotiopsis sp. NC0098]|nr:hypothetical protein BJ166DRAFT_515944 [Pestalotiopsis sp. NC0098]
MTPDIGAIITAANLLINYIDATVAYTDEARALYVGIKWDLEIVKSVAEHLHTRVQDAGSSPSDDITRLLTETSEYLQILMEKATASFLKMQASGFWRRAANQGLYFWRRNGLKQIQHDLREWTQRFEVRLLGLPPELRTILPAASGHGDSSSEAAAPNMMRPLLLSNTRLQKFKALTSEAKRQRIDELRCDTPPKIVQDEVDEGFYPVAIEVESGQSILTSRQLPPSVTPETKEFEKILLDLGELSAALHCLDPHLGIGLLQVEYYFYDSCTRQVFFAQKPPYPISEITTLENVIDRAPYSRRIGRPHLSSQLPMEWRLNLAKKLSEAVFFLHTAGFVHKNITVTSIAVITRRDDASPNSGMGDPYLMGFDMIRSNDGITMLEGASQGTVASWNLSVFHHPDRLKGDNVKRYIKNYDVYSLGVVLLQIGLWEPIVSVTKSLTPDYAKWPEELCDISTQLVLTMGSRFQRVVSWCLSLKGNYIISETEFVREVLDPFDDMFNSMS